MREVGAPLLLAVLRWSVFYLESMSDVVKKVRTVVLSPRGRAAGRGGARVSPLKCPCKCHKDLKQCLISLWTVIGLVRIQPAARAVPVAGARCRVGVPRPLLLLEKARENLSRNMVYAQSHTPQSDLCHSVSPAIR